MRVLLLASIIGRLLREDPHGFLVKAAERLRQSGVPAAVIPLVRQSRSRARELVDRGELSQAIEACGTNRADRVLRRRLIHQLEELHATPPAPSTRKPHSGDLRVLYLAANSLPFTVSGYTQRTHAVVRALRDRGVLIDAMTRLAYPLVVGKWVRGMTQEIDGVPYHRLLPSSYPSTPWQRHAKSIEMISEWVRDHDISIIHTTTNFPNAIVASRVAQQCGIPWIYEVRGELERTWLTRLPRELQQEAESSEFYQLARAQETAYARAADAVVALSEISRQQLIARGVAAEKIHVVPNAVDETFLKMSLDQQTLREELGLPVDKTIVGSVTSVVDYEGLDVLIESMLELPDSYIALIVGDGTARPGLEQLAESLGVADRVLFVGRQPSADIAKWYAVLDVFVVPRHDTLVCRTVTPIKALSAQALGVPVVASDLPALREVTGGVETYVPAGHADALAAAILGVEGNGAGREWAASRTWNMAAASLQRIYESLLEQDD